MVKSSWAWPGHYKPVSWPWLLKETTGSIVVSHSTTRRPICNTHPSLIPASSCTQAGEVCHSTDSHTCTGNMQTPHRKACNLLAVWQQYTMKVRQYWHNKQVHVPLSFFSQGCIEKYIDILDGKCRTKLLKSVYAGIHERPEDDPDLQDFFRFKCWT